VTVLRRLSGAAAASALVALAGLPCAAAPLRAQAAVEARGRVVVPRGQDTIPLARARVLLHRVGHDSQGPVDSAVADAEARFRFRFRADSGALYLLSTRYGGIEYFSAPIQTKAARPDTAIRLVAYDTSSTAPIAIEARHIVVPRVGSDGARAVLDLIVLRNDGLLARVAPDSLHPTWTLRLPPGAGEMEVGESDLSPDAVVRSGDTVKVLAPLAPGQKQLTLAYAAAPVRGRLEFPVGPAATPVNVLVEERDAQVAGGTLALADSQVIEGRNFRRFSGQVPAGGTIRVTLGSAGQAAARPVLAVLVALVAVLLAGAAVLVLRRARAPAGTAGAGAPLRLLDALAQLDDRYLEREHDTPPAEWSSYLTRRAELKAELERALAGRRAGPYV
jgi:hypothetical protein